MKPRCLEAILPAYNEARGLETVVQDLLSAKKSIDCDLRLIIVDDGSTDGTDTICRKLAQAHEAVHWVRHGMNRGYGGAIITGIREARGSHTAIFDADGQFRAEDLARLYRRMGGFEVVVGCRQIRADPWQRRLLGKLWTLAGNLFFGLDLRDLNCGLKIFDTALLKRLHPECLGAGITLEIMTEISSLNVPIRQLPCTHYPRIHGQQTGANPRVILRALGELTDLYRRRHQNRPRGSAATRSKDSKYERAD